MTAVSIIMLAIISFLFQLHYSCFPCGGTNNLLLAKNSRCKLSPVTLMSKLANEAFSVKSSTKFSVWNAIRNLITPHFGLANKILGS